MSSFKFLILQKKKHALILVIILVEQYCTGTKSEFKFINLRKLKSTTHKIKTAYPI